MKTGIRLFFQSTFVFLSLSAIQPLLAQVTVQNPPQNRYSLRQAIDIALQNNLDVRQSGLQVQGAELQLRQARLNRLPSASGFATQNFSSGRNINPFTNEFVEQGIRSNNFQLSGNATLFNGFALQNTIKQNDLFLQSNQQSLRATQNTVALTVVQNYLDVLTNEEQLEIARRQVEVSRGQVERTQRLVNAGTLPEANLYDLRAQQANDELTVVNTQNNVNLAKLRLLQAMNLPGYNPASSIEIERIPLEDPTLEPYPNSLQQIFETALQSMPEIRAAELRVQSDAVGVTVAKAGLMPTLSVSGALNTLYSSVGAQRLFEDGTRRIPQTIIFQGVPQQIFIEEVNFRGEPYTFFEQLSNNLNRSLSLNLQIPIFGRFQARNRITNATITQKSSEIAADNARLTLRQNIETAYTNMLAGLNRFRATQVQVQSLELAFRAAESRLNAGAINSVDYNIAKNNLDRARANLVQAKYDYIFRTKILDFYQNKPLNF